MLSSAVSQPLPSELSTHKALILRIFLEISFAYANKCLSFKKMSWHPVYSTARVCFLFPATVSDRSVPSRDPEDPETQSEPELARFW